MPKSNNELVNESARLQKTFEQIQESERTFQKETLEFLNSIIEANWVIHVLDQFEGNFYIPEPETWCRFIYHASDSMCEVESYRSINVRNSYQFDIIEFKNYVKTNLSNKLAVFR